MNEDLKEIEGIKVNFSIDMKGLYITISFLIASNIMLWLVIKDLCNHLEGVG